MNEQVKNILLDLQNTTARINIIRDLFQAKLDYFNEEDRRKINEFNEIVEQKREQIDGKISSFIHFVEKSFAPSPKELAMEKALQKLRADFLDFDKWDASIQNALLEREMKSFVIDSKDNKHKEKSPTIGTTVCYDNPEARNRTTINHQRLGSLSNCFLSIDCIIATINRTVKESYIGHLRSQ